MNDFRLRMRVLIGLSRPPVLILLAMFAMLGQTQAGAATDAWLFGRVLLVVAGYLLFSVVVNDLADEAVDRVNLAGDGARPLVVGSLTRRELPVVAATALAVSLGTAAWLGLVPLLVVVGGVVLTAAYSLPPTRLSARGALASVLLPAGYVAVPFLVGVLSVRSGLVRADLVLLAGLYVGFIGRILLKDFRDVRGDALFGKRTFLVRHGRVATCRLAAVFWVAGSLAMLGVRDVSVALVLAQAVFVGVALSLLRALSVADDARRDEWLISAVAVVGRGMVLVLIAHLAAVDRGWLFWQLSALTAALVVVTVGQASAMVRRGPVPRLRLPLPGQPASSGIENVNMRSASMRA